MTAHLFLFNIMKINLTHEILNDKYTEYIYEAFKDVSQNQISMF